jgi:hypothetical protein
MIETIEKSDQRVVATQMSSEDLRRSSTASLQEKHDKDRIRDLESTILQLVKAALGNTLITVKPKPSRIRH